MAGIAIGRNQVCAVVLDAAGGKHQVRAIHTQDLTMPLFTAQPTIEAEAMLVDALRTVSGEFRDLFASVHVALPDTVIRSTVFELDELPKSAAMRESLLRWRFAKDWQRPENSLNCHGFDLGEDQGKHLYLGQAGDSLWLACVRRALARAGIVPWSLNAASVCRFNCFHDAIAGNGGALLSLDPDCWNLQLWDEQGRVRQLHTRLRESLAAEDEAASIADEAERVILAYVQACSNRAVGKLYLAGREEEIAFFAAVFDKRLNEPSVTLHADQGIPASVAGMRNGLAPLALAAALSI
jgi:hypothetical protein